MCARTQTHAHTHTTLKGLLLQEGLIKDIEAVHMGSTIGLEMDYGDWTYYIITLARGCRALTQESFTWLLEASAAFQCGA